MTTPHQDKRREVTVTFLPSGKIQHARDSLSIFALAREARVPIYHTCNGIGTCGKCRVRVTGQVSNPTKIERRFLRSVDLAKGWRLACQVWPRGEVTVEVPTVGPQQILSAGLQVKVKIRPNLQKISFSLTEPSLQDQTGDYERACRELGLKPESTAPPEVLRSLAGSLRPEWQATAVISDRTILGIEPGDSTSSFYGVAFDIGTTTLVGYLHDLWSGEELAITSDLNPQVSHGADVISRIQHAVENEQGLRELQIEVCNRLNKMLRELTAEAGIDRKQIYEVSIAGNTVMQHLMLGIDPRNIAFAPYIPVVQTALILAPGPARMDINPAGRVYVMPGIASYVGGDIVADILASRLWRHKGTAILVDIGTNGEIVLCRNRSLYACSAPAGPCFEGANISSGMRAADGAISAVRLDGRGDLEIETIGSSPARGFCGSGLIDAVAILLDSGLLDDTGRLYPPEEVPPEVPAPLRDRVRLTDGMAEVVFSSSKGHDVTLTQADIRELQNAKGSIQAGINVLCSRMDVNPAEVDAVLLAGAFGNFVRPSSARRIGLLPQCPLEKIVSIGNAAGTGSKMALLSSVERRRASKLRLKVRYVELSGTPDFRDAYMDAMFFPNSEQEPLTV